MRTALIIILVILILIPCSTQAERVICESFSKITKNKVPSHKIMPILKIVLSIIMLVLGYSLLTNICLVAVIIQNLVILKKY